MTAVVPARDLPGVIGERARRFAELIGDRLADPERVAKVAGDPANVDPVFGAGLWEPATLSHGHPGIAMLFGELAREDEAWRAAAHQHLGLAMRAAATGRANGLFAGPASVLAAAQTCSQPGSYQVLRERLLRWLIGDQQARIAAWRDRRDRGIPGVGWSAYDVVNGLSGTGRLLLDALVDPEISGTSDPQLVEQLRDALLETVRFLVELTVDVEVDGRVVPGWWIPPELQPSDGDRLDYPHGDFNLGLAHGIPAALTFLSRSHSAGYRTEDSPAAIGRIVDWVLRWQGTDEAGTYWPARVSWQQEGGDGVPSMDFTRSAWCYGAPGVAVALHSAGLALDEDSWQRVSLDALHSVLRRDRQRWRLEGATLCHGYAGLVAIMLRTAIAAGDQVLQRQAIGLSSSILDHCDAQLPFLVSHLVPDSAAGWRKATGYRQLNVAGLLEGAAGVGCALLDVARAVEGSDVRRPASWARAMMLA